MKKIVIVVLKILLITFIGSILMKFIIPSLGISNSIINALLTPILLGVLIYFLFRKNKPKTNL